ncbi:MAG: DUF2917 domain-containing protein [Pseudomonadota bacterium]|nr:DUF2917 domain-containing protein [Pseudomonadota bacterium]
MIKSFTTGQHRIEAGELLAGTLAQVAALTVAGTGARAWVTIEGSATDYWLADGDQLHLPAHKLVVIEADRCALLLHLHDATTPSALAPPTVRVDELGRSSALAAQRRPAAATTVGAGA